MKVLITTGRQTHHRVLVESICLVCFGCVSPLSMFVNNNNLTCQQCRQPDRQALNRWWLPSTMWFTEKVRKCWACSFHWLNHSDHHWSACQKAIDFLFLPNLNVFQTRNGLERRSDRLQQPAESTMNLESLGYCHVESRHDAKSSHQKLCRCNESQCRLIVCDQPVICYDLKLWS